jgi:putative restriction endonuclease
MTLVERILALPNSNHREALLWFLEKTGQVVGWPDKTTNGVVLATKAAGIFKPKDIDYILSVRSSVRDNATTLYNDKEPVYEDDGTWSYLYQHEIQSNENPENLWRNKAMILNFQHNIPIAVFRQLPDKSRKIYKILGLAFVRDYNPQTGYFFLQGINDNSTLSEKKTTTNNLSNTADIESDNRRWEKTISVIREGQSKFRAALLSSYYNRCAVTGYDISEALEAAHIRPYRGLHTNEVRNGILLRADIHNLFDFGVIGINPDNSKIVLSKKAEHSKYSNLAGKQITMPDNSADRPDPLLLDCHLRLHGLKN